MDAKDKSYRIEARSRKDVFDPHTRKVEIRDIRTPTKRKRSMSNLTVGQIFSIKSVNKDKGSVAFKIKNIAEKTVELEYTVGKSVKHLTLDLIERKSTLYERIKKAYVKSDGNKDNQQQPEERPRASRRSSRRR